MFEGGVVACGLIADMFYLPLWYINLIYALARLLDSELT